MDMVKYSKGGYWMPTIPGCKCDNCGTIYTAHNKKSRFCSRTCAIRFRTKDLPDIKTERECPECKSVWSGYPSNTSVFCSKSCMRKNISRASLEKRQRNCSVCRKQFTAKATSTKGVACSKKCLLEIQRRNSLGKKLSAEAKEKQSASLKAAWSDPEVRGRWSQALTDSNRKWRADPANAERVAKIAELSSARMKARHTDPAWQKIRDERSSIVMKENWRRYRDHYRQSAVERYRNSLEAGVGINSDDAKALKRTAAKWIMTKAQEAMHTETDYDEVFSEVSARMRREMPYDGPSGTADYFEYLKQLGIAVVNSKECRSISDSFMAEAIPKFAQQWRELRKKGGMQ